MEVQGVSCTTCTKKQSMIMAYLYRKHRSPFWYVQYVDSDKRKHDKSTGLRADDPNDTVKAKILRAELEAKEYQRMPPVNGAAWDSWSRNSSRDIANPKRPWTGTKTLGNGSDFGCNARGFMLQDNSPTGSGSSTWTGVPISKKEPARPSAEILPS